MYIFYLFIRAVILVTVVIIIGLVIIEFVKGQER